MAELYGCVEAGGTKFDLIDYFADALHWACSAGCKRFVTFDDRRLARRARRPGLYPEVVLLG